ncbi:Zn-ribbon domain-containing OB-fold protein [Candidatus Bathyarchaeota archaeon]|nr:Zn-ribbon domain-containing OB-fold protein [Candidatus Bathyarchaeota archaeon]RJS80455.1 MAG: Zn-ribbon domain-containing OB-fold protein [Candidatus Bathyarchaeota archaeon]
MKMAYKPKKIVESLEYNKQWDEWARQGNWSPVGWRWIEGPKGYRLDKLSTTNYLVIQRPHASLYHHSYGMTSKFFKGLLEKKLYGSKCPKCGSIYLPPRAHCWNAECRLEETEWVELPPRGEVHTFSVMAFSATPFLKTLPFIIAYVRVEGCCTTVPTRLLKVNPWDVYPGLKVNINFVEHPKGDIMDIYCTPAETPDPSKRIMSSETIERLKDDMRKVKEWVVRKFGSEAKPSIEI